MKKPAPRKQETHSDLAIYLLLFVATIAVYSRVLSYPFLSFDDNQGLLGNPQVRYGLSWSGIVWAFTSSFASNWFPITWISHMLDFQLFGDDAAWHHFTNLLIHVVSAMLLFAVLKRMTARKWESLFVAFVFALHPLHVESVAWISERKDVLFAFFWFLTTWLYLDFLDKRTPVRYLLMAAAFCLGLMSKQMIVTLPFALLLLDLWPLKRTAIRTAILEKIPLIALSIAASTIAFLAQKSGGAVQSLEKIPLASRIANALVAYAAYLANFLWPFNLGAYYPYKTELPIWQPALAAIALAAISILVLLAYRKRPYLAVGWFWYLGTLVPVIGLVQLGHQSRADRYTYVPLIGISIMLAWAAAEALEKWPQFRPTLKSAAISIGAAWMLLTWIQVSFWKDSITLYRRAISVTENNYVMHENLGVDLASHGQPEEAIRELFTSIEENPDQPRTHSSLGGVLYSEGRLKEAIYQFETSIRLRPDDAAPHSNLGNALLDQRRIDEAIAELNTALRLNPQMETAYYGLGRARTMQNRPADAIAYFSEALRINPNFVQARQQLNALRGGQ